MNHDFQQHVTSSAFVLTLSRPMIDLLDLTARFRGGEEPWLTRLNAYYGLRRRGLVENHKGIRGRGIYLTEEGKLVLELCRRANLVAKLKAAA